MQIKDIDPVYISELLLRKEVGQAGYCKLKFHASEKGLEGLLERQDISIQLDDGEPVFYGKIHYSEIRKSLGGFQGSLEAFSSIWPAAVSGARRFFQKPDKTFGDVCKRIKLDNGNPACDRKLKNLACPPFLMQSGDNVSFLRLLAEMSGRKMWIQDNTKSSAGIKLSFCLDDAVLGLDRARLFELAIIRKNGQKALRLSSRDWLAPGSLVELEGIAGTFLVESAKASINQCRDVFEAVLYEYSECTPEKIIWPDKTTTLLSATVQKNNDPDQLGRLQLAIDPEDAEDSEQKSWLPQLTPYAGEKTGIFFMPDPQNRVALLVGNGKAWVIGAIRENNVEEEAVEPANKYIGNNFNQRMIWKEKSLELRSGERSIILDDEGIHLHSDKADLNMDDSGLVAKSSRDTSMETSANLTLDATGPAKLLGSKVELGK